MRNTKIIESSSKTIHLAARIVNTVPRPSSPSKWSSASKYAPRHAVSAVMIDEARSKVEES